MAHTEYRPPSWPFSAYSSTGGAFEVFNCPMRQQEAANELSNFKKVNWIRTRQPAPPISIAPQNAPQLPVKVAGKVHA